MARRRDERTVRALKGRVGVNGRSTEVKDRAVLAQVGPRRRTLAETLASMPNVGVDADFERVDSAGRFRHEID